MTTTITTHPLTMLRQEYLDLEQEIRNLAEAMKQDEEIADDMRHRYRLMLLSNPVDPALHQEVMDELRESLVEVDQRYRDCKEQIARKYGELKDKDTLITRYYAQVRKGLKHIDWKITLVSGRLHEEWAMSFFNGQWAIVDKPLCFPEQLVLKTFGLGDYLELVYSPDHEGWRLHFRWRDANKHYWTDTEGLTIMTKLGTLLNPEAKKRIMELSELEVLKR